MNAALHLTPTRLLLLFSGDGGVCAGGQPWNCGSRSTGRIRCTWTDSRGCVTDSRGCVASSGRGGGVKKQVNKPSSGGEACYILRYYFFYEWIIYILHQLDFFSCFQVTVEFVRVVSPGIAVPEVPEGSGALGRTAKDVLPAPDVEEA